MTAKKLDTAEMLQYRTSPTMPLGKPTSFPKPTSPKKHNNINPMNLQQKKSPVHVIELYSLSCPTKPTLPKAYNTQPPNMPRLLYVPKTTRAIGEPACFFQANEGNEVNESSENAGKPTEFSGNLIEILMNMYIPHFVRSCCCLGQKN